MRRAKRQPRVSGSPLSTPPSPLTPRPSPLTEVVVEDRSAWLLRRGRLLGLIGRNRGEVRGGQFARRSSAFAWRALSFLFFTLFFLGSLGAAPREASEQAEVDHRDRHPQNAHQEKPPKPHKSQHRPGDENEPPDQDRRPQTAKRT